MAANIVDASIAGVISNSLASLCMDDTVVVASTMSLVERLPTSSGVAMLAIDLCDSSMVVKPSTITFASLGAVVECSGSCLLSSSDFSLIGFLSVNDMVVNGLASSFFNLD